MVNFSPGRNFGPPSGLQFSCDYKINFRPGAMLKTGQETFVGKLFTFTTQAVRMPKFIFQPGLKFECDYLRFFSPFDWKFPARFVKTGWKFQPGLKLSSCNLFSRAEISAWLAGLKFAI